MTAVRSVSSGQSRSQSYVYTGYCRCCRGCRCCYSVLLFLEQLFCCFLLLFVIVYRMAKFIAGSLNLIPVYYFFFFNLLSNAIYI